MSELLGGSWTLEFETREETTTPAAVAPPEKTIDTFRNDPMIQKALEIFKAEIQSDR